MCDSVVDLEEEPVNLISERPGNTRPKISHQHEEQQREFVEAGRRQLEHFLSRSFLGQSSPFFGGLSHSKLASAMDPLQSAFLSHFGSNGHIPDNGIRRPMFGRKRRLEDRSSESLPLVKDSLNEPQHHPLFSHGICRWTGCEMIFETYGDFISHLNSEHVISDRSTAQTRVQVQIVSQLELQIQKEKDRLEAMMDHFNKLKEEEQRCFAFELKKETAQILGMNENGGRVEEEENKDGLHASNLPTLTRMKAHNNNTNSNQVIKGAPSKIQESRRGSYNNNKENDEDSPRSQSPLSPPNKGKQISNGVKVHSPEKGALDPENEVIRNREFYRTQDVRPPCTYAALIRQAINESMGRQLTLNEIYTWFQNTFAYFRRNAATWKNAVRHNLSLHKCFMRVENVKGAVWTVDETEYHRRRPQRGIPTSSSSSSKSPPSPDGLSNGGTSELLSYQQKQAAMVAEHQAYLQGLGASLSLRRDDYYYPAFPFSFGLKTEVPEDSEEHPEDGGGGEDGRSSPVAMAARTEVASSSDNQRESLESNDSSSHWN